MHLAGQHNYLCNGFWQTHSVSVVVGIIPFVWRGAEDLLGDFSGRRILWRIKDYIIYFGGGAAEDILDPRYLPDAFCD